MKKINFRWYGLGALGIYGFGCLTNLLSQLHLVPPNFGPMLLALTLVVALILAEIWSIMFWKKARSRLSVATLTAVNLIFICNLVSSLPESTIIFNRLFG